MQSLNKFITIYHALKNSTYDWIVIGVFVAIKVNKRLICSPTLKRF